LLVHVPDGGDKARHAVEEASSSVTVRIREELQA